MWVLILVCVSPLTIVKAQVANNSNIYVNDTGEFFIASGNFTFGGASSLTKTTRSILDYGVISFAQGATWSGASNNHYIDGFVRYYGDNYFLCPIGNNSIYAPIAIDANSTVGIDAAYFNTNPSSISTNLGTGIVAISSVEYWKIASTASSEISLTWRTSSGVNDLLLTPSLTYLTIVGFNGSEWVEVPSFYDATSILATLSDVSQGSITSTAEVSLATFQAFTIGVKGIASCYPIVNSSGNIKTWNGSIWYPSSPTINDPVVINQPYNGGSFAAYSVQLNADITLLDGQTLDIVDSFSGTGKIVMSSEASVMQRNSTATPPKILLKKITNPMRRFDYVFLSSPLNSFSTFFGQLTNPNNTAVNGQFGVYANSPFYNYFTDNDSGNSVTVTSSNVATGRGFAATVSPSRPPYTVSSVAGSWFNEKFPVHIKAEGTTNNGDLLVPMPTSAGWARIGNPYPSPINANKLLDALGDDIRKTIYYWTFNTPRQNWDNNALNYNSADYATFNYSGGVAACSTCEVPNGMIATMQSVYIRKVNTSPITFTMTNCLRDLSGNDVFFRSSNDVTGKFRLNMIGSSGSFSQLMVAYNPVTTTGYDNGYDSVRLSSGISSEFATLINGQNSNYAIQTRGAFEVTDVVPVQVTKRLEENFTISLATKEGVFQSNEVKIYLLDKLLNVYHDLGTSSYNFVQSSSVDNTRFEIVYQNNVLSNNDLIKSNAMAFISNDTFIAQANQNMIKIQLFDLTGRLIQTFSNINNTLLSKPFFYPQSVYIAKIELDNGNIVSQKVINN